jgi:hypothetical protein
VRLLEKIKDIKDKFVKHSGIGLLLLLTLAFASCASHAEFNRVKAWADSAFHTSETNAVKIDHLQTEVAKQADKPVPPPVIIVQKETKYEKPFTDSDLLARARKLRHEQKSSTDNR